MNATMTARRLRFFSPELAVTVVRTIGYEARCACGWVGSTHKSWEAARTERRAHLRECPRRHGA